MSVDAEATGKVRAWCLKAGHLYFGVEGKRGSSLGFLRSRRTGVRYRIGNEEHCVSGSGYHDHNWGDVPMQTLMHNRYWARTSVRGEECERQGHPDRTVGLARS
jgi:hypothetical protein